MSVQFCQLELGLVVRVVLILCRPEERRGHNGPADCSTVDLQTSQSSLLTMTGSSLSALPVQDNIIMDLGGAQEDLATSYSYIFHFEQVGLLDYSGLAFVPITNHHNNVIFNKYNPEIALELLSADYKYFFNFH